MTFAYTLYLAGMCSCGHPTKICQHPDNDGWFVAKTVVCNAQAEIDRVTGAEKYKPEPGERFYTEYMRPAGKPLRALTPDTQPNNRGDEPGDRDEG